MIELPEAIVLAEQINKNLVGKVINDVVVNKTPHKFAWFYGDPNDYESKIKNKKILKANNHAGFVKIKINGRNLLFSDGAKLTYLNKDEKVPEKHQLLLNFKDDSKLIVKIQMYGGIWCSTDEESFNNPYYDEAINKPTPLDEEFDFNYFIDLVNKYSTDKMSVKQFLATEQRIPGFGNGVLQDVLFNSRINPKSKMSSLDKKEIKKLFNSINSTIKLMVVEGGRDTEKDLFGNHGGYKTKLSKYTYGDSCKICGGRIIKQSYLGGSIYYCENCQPIKK